ncbi:MAG: Maf family protein [Candidatus Aminicenantia bacterium]
MKWILASQSPRRIELLSRLGLDFIVQPAQIQEQRSKNEKPESYVLRVSLLKAKKAAQNFSSGVVIGADTIVVLNNQFLGKPENENRAKEILMMLSGKAHFVFTGIALIQIKTQKLATGYAKSKVYFSTLSPKIIDWYIKSLEPLDKAGAYGIQGKAGMFIEKIEGCYFNVVGFPLNLFYQLTQKLGINFID